MTFAELLADPPKLHVFDGKLVASWKLADEELSFLEQHLTQRMRTIETGAGISTIVFALKGTEHTCIVPDQAVVDRIRLYCDAHKISHSAVTFLVGASEYVLPQIADTSFDLALIDGRHGFPTPFIDWFYMSGLLNVGGILVIDDLHIWTCELLTQFLLAEDNWTMLRETLSAAIFLKQGNGSQHREYTDQPFVYRRSRQASLFAKVNYLVGLLKRHNFRLFRTTLSLGIKSAAAGRFGVRTHR
jgi:hypothetical protein